MHKTKALTGLKLSIKDASKGTFRAVFATFNVIDHDGDVTLPGAFTDGQKVRISAYNHASWGKGMLPVGKGTIHQDEIEAWVDGEFFLSTGAGSDTYEVVKAMDDLQEWSYGFDVLDGHDGEKDGQSVQFLVKLDVHEVSPVLLGAGLGTRTTAVKGKQLASDLASELDEAGTERFGADRVYVYVDDFDLDQGWVVYCVSGPDSHTHMRVSYSRDAAGAVTLAADAIEVERTTDYRPKGRDQKLSDHLGSVVADVEAVTERVADVVARRAEKGKGLGQESYDELVRLEAALAELRKGAAPVTDDQAAAIEQLKVLRERIRHDERTAA